MTERRQTYVLSYAVQSTPELGFQKALKERHKQVQRIKAHSDYQSSYDNKTAAERAAKRISLDLGIEVHVLPQMELDSKQFA